MHLPSMLIHSLALTICQPKRAVRLKLQSASNSSVKVALVVRLGSSKVRAHLIMGTVQSAVKSALKVNWLLRICHIVWDGSEFMYRCGHGCWRDNSKEKTSWGSIHGIVPCMRMSPVLCTGPTLSDVMQHFSKTGHNRPGKGLDLAVGLRVLCSGRQMFCTTSDSDCKEFRNKSQIPHKLQRLIAQPTGRNNVRNDAIISSMVKALDWITVVTSMGLVYMMCRSVETITCWLPGSVPKTALECPSL